MCIHKQFRLLTKWFSVLFLLVFLQMSHGSQNPIIAKQCGKFHSQDDFKGSEFLLRDQEHTLNIAEGIHTPAGWNKTGSLQVAPTCEMKVCDETYFDGVCKKLGTGRYSTAQLSSNVGYHIASAGCSCAKECKCSDIFMKKSSCARAYLEGGCKTCNSFYTDLPTASGSLPAVFVGKVEAFRLRKGCRLIIYAEQSQQGQAQTVSQEILENFSGAFRSYKCECNDNEYVPRASPPRPATFPPLVNVPTNPNALVAMLKDQRYANHPGLKAAFMSRKKKRSSKNAYILLLGTTGSGKSSAINLLFDNANITAVGDYVSTTTDIHEFRIKVPLNEYGLSNTELGVIDTPGLGDTRGVAQDAKYLATLDNFLTNHEELNSTIPNAILIFHKFNDNRFAEEGTRFVQMLRGIELFRERIVDKNFANVIHVLTHFCSESKSTQRRPGDRIKMFKKTIEEFSILPRPTIITVAENKGSSNDLPMVNGYYKLPNNEYYPRNLFEKLELITKNGGDPIGLGVFRTAFRYSEDFQISGQTTKLVGSTDEKVERYRQILQNTNFGIPSTEISELLRRVWEDELPTDLKSRYSNSLPYLQKSLQMLNINKMTDVPKTPSDKLRLMTAIKHDPATSQLLKTALNITAPRFPVSPVAGFGYNLFQEKALNSTPFLIGQPHQTDIGYLVPAFLSCKLERSSSQLFSLHDSPEAYLQHRLLSLGLQGQIAKESYKAGLKPGHNFKAMLRKTDGSKLTGTRELQRFQFTLNERPVLHNDFVNIVKALPAVNESDPNSMAKWTAFFNRYGTHVVKSVHGGGAIQVEIRSGGPPDLKVAEALFNLIKFADDMTSGVEGNGGNAAAPRTTVLNGVDHTLKFLGGDPKYHIKDLNTVSMEDAAKKLTGWKQSLRFSPSLLSNEMRLLPMSQVVKQIGQEYAEQMEKATRAVYKSTITYIPEIKVKVGTESGSLPAPGPAREDTPIMTLFRAQQEKSRQRIQSMLDEIKRMEELNVAATSPTSKPSGGTVGPPGVGNPQGVNGPGVGVSPGVSPGVQTSPVYTPGMPYQPGMQYPPGMRYPQGIQYPPGMQYPPAVYPPGTAPGMGEPQTNPTVIVNYPKPWLSTLFDPQGGVVAQTMGMIKTFAQLPTAGGGSCLKQGTKILMMDGSEKAVELLKPGDIVVDKDMLPTRVLGVAHELLMGQKFYSFDNNSFFFTNSHLFVGPKNLSFSSENFTLFAKSKEYLYYNNPLLKYLSVNTMPDNGSFELFHLDNSSNNKLISIKIVTVTEDPKVYPVDTPIYFLHVNSSTGTYVANGYVCRHETPPFERWPNTMSILFRLIETNVFDKLSLFPYNFDTEIYLQNSINSTAKKVEKFFENKEWNESGDENKYDVMTLGDVDLDVCIQRIYSNPTLSSAGIGFYARVGQVIAKYLDEQDENRIDSNIIGRIQYELYKILTKEIDNYSK